MSDALEDAHCPRCGGAVEWSMSSSVDVTCGGCKHAWETLKMFQRESIARDLAGTRAARIGPEYLDPAKSKDDNVVADMQELVALVKLTTLEKVVDALHAAIDGRDEQYRHDNGSARTRHERDVLKGMLTWVQNEKAKYGDDD